MPNDQLNSGNETYHIETVYTVQRITQAFDDESQFRDTFIETCEINDVEWINSGTNNEMEKALVKSV